MSSLDPQPLRLELTALQAMEPAERKKIGAGVMVLIRSTEHRAWWRSGAAGYTTYQGDAGVYSFDEAWAHTSHCGPEKGIVFEEARRVSTPGKSDADLLRWAVKIARPRTRTSTRREAVMQTFGLGSTYATALCNRFGVDPEEMVKP